MKTISSALKAHVQGEVTTLATCWKVTRQDGTVYGFTDHDSDIIVSAVTYKAETGFMPTAIQSNEKLSVDNMNADGIFDSSTITEGDLSAGLYDYADVEIFMVNYASVGMGLLKLKKGTLGEVTMKDYSFETEFRSLSQKLQQNIGEVYSPLCRADFGDARCGITVQPAFWEPATVYASGDVVLPVTANGKRYICTVSGTSQQASWSSSTAVNVSLTNSSTTVVQTSGVNAGAMVNQNMVGSKFYWEMEASALASTVASAVAFGVTWKTTDVGYSSVQTAGRVFTSQFTSTPAAGDYYMAAFNGNSKKLWVGQNGSWLSGDPETGASAYAVLPAVYNRVHYSQEMNRTAYWSAPGLSVYSNYGPAPYGSNTAEYIGSPSGTYHWFGQNMTVAYASGDIVHAACYVHSTYFTKFAMRLVNKDTNNTATVRWAWGSPPTFVEVQSNSFASVISYGQDSAPLSFYRMRMKVRLKENCTSVQLRMYTSWDVSGYFFGKFWGAQVNEGDNLLSYVTTTTSYSSVEFYPWLGMKSNADSGTNNIHGVFTSAAFNYASVPANYLELGEPSWSNTVGGSTADGTAGWVTYESYIKFGTVTGVTDNSHFTDTTRTEASSTFVGGKLTWTTGLNINRSMDVKDSTSAGLITLFQKMPYTISVGDEYKLVKGCKKTVAACQAYASENGSRGNIYNFRGEPYIPGPDQVNKFGGQ